MAELRHLIVVVPGLGGSVLRRGGWDGETVWDGTLLGAAQRLVNPEPLRLPPDSGDDGVQAVAVIGSTAITPFWAPIRGYDRLLYQLAAPFTPYPTVEPVDGVRPDLSADIVAVPYDFRRSVVDAAADVGGKVWERIEARRHLGKPDRLIVVAHSLGGLVARYWLAGDERAATSCDLLVTLGTPHLGSPEALDTLVNGLRKLGRRWNRASEVMRSWPSLHDLLPNYPVVWDERDQTRKAPHELALPRVNGNLVERARQAHTHIEEGWSNAEGRPAAAVSMVPFIGVGQRTLQAAWWDGVRLRVGADAPGWLQPVYPGGDGTVPQGAAFPRGLRLDLGRPVACRHGWFVDLDQVGELVRWVTDGGAVRGEPRVRLQPLGLTLPDLLRERDPATGTLSLATLDGEPVEPSRTPVVRARVDGPGRPWSQWPCEHAGGEWVVEVPALDVGVYEVEASVPGSIGPDCPPIREIVAVLPREVIEG